MFLPWFVCQLSTKFPENRSNSLCIFLLTNKLTIWRRWVFNHSHWYWQPNQINQLSVNINTKQAVGGRPPRTPASWQYLRFFPQVAPFPACWLFKTSATSWSLTCWPWKWCPSQCDVGYFCDNFSLPSPLSSRLRPDVRDRQTPDRQKSDVRQSIA